MTQTAPNTHSNTKPTEKPEMAAKKTWDFKVTQGKVEDIPAPVRTGGQKMPFPFDDMKLGAHFDVPADFWESRGIAKTKNTASLNSDRIRRAFYNWRDAANLEKKEASRRKELALAFSHTHEGQEYKGSRVYLTNRAA